MSRESTKVWSERHVACSPQEASCSMSFASIAHYSLLISHQSSGRARARARWALRLSRCSAPLHSSRPQVKLVRSHRSLTSIVFDFVRRAEWPSQSPQRHETGGLSLVCVALRCVACDSLLFSATCARIRSLVRLRL